MKLNEILFEMKEININKLNTFIKSSSSPIYIIVAGSVGSGKSFVTKRDLKNIKTIDPDAFTMELGDGVYDSKNVAKSMSLVKKETEEMFKNGQSFLQQGTAANLQSTINKLKKAKQSGFITVLFYVDTDIEQAMKQVEKRVASGGHGSTIDLKKIETTSNSARLTFRALSGVDFDKATAEDLSRVEQALEKTEKNLDDVRKHLDFFIRIENKY